MRALGARRAAGTEVFFTTEESPLMKVGDSSGKNILALHTLPSGHAQRGKNDTLEALPRFIEKIQTVPEKTKRIDLRQMIA